MTQLLPYLLCTLLLCGLVVVVLLLCAQRKRGDAARLDALTGGHSEAEFQAQAVQILRRDGAQFALVSMQLAGLAQLCAPFGPEHQPDALRYIGSLLTEQLSAPECAVRTGEDTFFFLLKNRDTDEISLRLARIVQAVTPSGVPEDAFRFGVCLPAPGEADIKVLWSRAVHARISCPAGQRWALYAPDDHSRIPYETSLAFDLEHALASREFTVYYQPLVRLLDQRLAGAEALVRWNHPQHGLLSPDMFLPVAERTRKTWRIDCFVLDEVCRTLARWQSEGREPCPISVNLSRASLLWGNLTDDCLIVCRRHGVNPALLTFEWPEQLLLELPTQAEQQLSQLHAAGFHCAVDHFGAEAASLHLLTSFDIDMLKLDLSFFSGKHDRRGGRYVVEAVFKFASQLHIQAVAVGVDAPEQAAYLQRAACDFMQGFYCFKPMPIDRFEKVAYSGTALASASLQSAAVPVPAAQDAPLSRGIVFFSYHPETDRVEFSDAFSPVLGGKTVFQNASALLHATDLLYENDREDFIRLLERCRRTGGWVQNTLRFHLSEGRYGWLDVYLHQQHFGAEHVISGTMLDISRWKKEVNRWKEQASRDVLTGLYNRAHFEQAVQACLAQPSCTGGAVLFLDVDDFKHVNDAYGHPFGDDVLCYVAKQLLGTFRHTDIIARYGGDEFIVFAPSIEQNVLEERLTRLCAAFRFPYRTGAHNCKISVSLGAALFPVDGADYETLLHHADCALYEAKARGKDQFALYAPSMQGRGPDDVPYWEASSCSH